VTSGRSGDCWGRRRERDRARAPCPRAGHPRPGPLPQRHRARRPPRCLHANDFPHGAGRLSLALVRAAPAPI
jgi:hypothetical protein